MPELRESVSLQQGDDTIFQDAAATFRSLKLNDSFPAEGDAVNDDSSSSSSSNDEADVTLRMPPSVVMQVSSLHTRQSVLWQFRNVKVCKYTSAY